MKYVVVDWMRDIVEPWFRTLDTGTFLQEVADHSLYNDLSDIGIFYVPGNAQFKRAPVISQVRAWFKHRINSIHSEVGESTLYILRGCAPHENLFVMNRVRQLIRKMNPDDEMLQRIGKRYNSSFVIESKDFLIDEAFFNTYIDEIFDYCKKKATPTVQMYRSSVLTTDSLKRAAVSFFSSGEDVLYKGNLKGLKQDARCSISLKDSNDYFTELMTEHEIESKSDSSEVQVVVQGTNEFLEMIKKTI